MIILKKIALICVIALLTLTLKAQHLKKTLEVLDAMGEIFIKFDGNQIADLKAVKKFMSIDKLDRTNGKYDIYAYLSKKQFEVFLKENIEFELLTTPSVMAEATMCPNLEGVKNWDCYPTYDQYIALMQSFETDFPDLCKLYEFGQSVDNRKLLVVKISDNVAAKEEEPEFLYTSTMHGNETTGYVLMLRLIYYLLNNYTSDARIAELVNNTEIWINPLSNPDGAYDGGNSTLLGAIRGNYYNIDLNRNFPDVWAGDHPDGEVWQKETIAMMDFLADHNFTLAANFHGGAEVVNYPWDGWKSYQKVHADNSWYQEISHEYADTVQLNSSGYMTGYDDGITNGGDWYVIDGGRQDYMNYFMHSREVTIELSDDYIPNADTLNFFWKSNYRSFLNYIDRVHEGISGKVTDQYGQPVKAKIYLSTHDFDNSYIYSDTSNGMYYRMLPAGNYHLVASQDGYATAEFDVTVFENVKTELNIILQKDPLGVQINNTFGNITNPFNDKIQLKLDLMYPENIEIQLFDILGKKILYRKIDGQTGLNQIEIETGNIKQGIYICKVNAGHFSSDYKLLKMSK